MLITISGIAGSGKTTAARQTVALLRAQGIEARHHRFQGLRCFTLLSPSRSRTANTPTTPRAAKDPVPGPLRGVGYRRSRLTLARSLVYLMRIVAFRLYRLGWSRREWHVLNRYFYDSFAHYELESRLERSLFRILSSCIPRPELAILVTAPFAVLASRRPAYAAEYLTGVSQGYDRLRILSPQLVTIATDDRDAASAAIAGIVRQRLDQ